jgi:tetratricopeptide (TPR) repeat protein
LLNVARAVEPEGAVARLREALHSMNRQALEALGTSEESHDLLPASLHALAVALWMVDASQSAVAMLRAAQRRHPDDFWVNEDLGIALYNSQPPVWEESIRYLTTAVGLRSGSSGARLNLGYALQSNGDLDGAIAAYRETLRLKSDYAEAHNDLGCALAEKGNLEGAIAEYHTTLRLKPNYAEAHNNLGFALRLKGDLDGAIARYRMALQFRTQYPEAHNNLGNALGRKGDVDGAIAECREALHLKPNYAEAHANLADALAERGDRDEAIAEYHTAIQLQPDYAAAHLNLANALLNSKGDLDGAIAEYQEAIRLKPDYPEARVGVGCALEARGDISGAIAAYHEAIYLKLDYAQAHYNLGKALGKKGDREGAIAAYRAALSHKPDFPEAHTNLGNALRSKGELEGAIAEFREALRINPNLAETHCGLGRTLLQQGRFEAAVSELRLGHELGSRRSDWNLPSAEWIRNAERMVELESRLPGLLQGAAQPNDTGERLALAGLCQEHKQLYAASARWYAEAFAAEPRLELQYPHRYDAACAAALADCGQGKDAGPLDDAERTRLRRQAFDWLTADLAAWGKVAEKPEGHSQMRQILTHCQYDPDLACVRGDALAGLPEAERADWQKLWQDAEVLRQRVMRSADTEGTRDR